MPDKKDRIYLDGAWRYLLDNREIIDEDDMASNSATRVPTQQSVKAYADALIAANDAMVFKGVIDCSGNPNYPAADCGHTYKVSVAGKIGGASGVVVEVGDIAICKTDSSASGDHATVGANWIVLQTNIEDLDSVIDALISTHASIAATHFAAWEILTIVDGAINITGKTGKCFLIAGEGGLADTLITITGGSDGQEITLAGYEDTISIIWDDDGNIDPNIAEGTGVAIISDPSTMLNLNYGELEGRWHISNICAMYDILAVNGLYFGGNAGISIYTSSTDHTSSGIFSSIFAGETFTGNGFQLGYLGAELAVKLAKADSASTMPAFCMSRNSEEVTIGNSLNIILSGYVRDDTWNWTPGGKLYVSPDTAGAMTQTKPEYPDIAQWVATAITATIIEVDFKSSSDDETDPIFSASEAASFAAGDKSKLDAIEAGADVTDATNVAAAGALMASTLTERGSIIFRNATVPAELLHGNDGDVLTSKGHNADPVFAAPAGGGGTSAQALAYAIIMGG